MTGNNPWGRRRALNALVARGLGPACLAAEDSDVSLLLLRHMAALRGRASFGHGMSTARRLALITHLKTLEQILGSPTGDGAAEWLAATGGSADVVRVLAEPGCLSAAARTLLALVRRVPFARAVIRAAGGAARLAAAVRETAGTRSDASGGGIVLRGTRPRMPEVYLSSRRCSGGTLCRTCSRCPRCMLRHRHSQQGLRTS
mmetsp:Transcript_21461/g.64184  ORF Transcript_21461/g.64184 Transcript_21461/m.64184 type:complete len:202 (-) Transcript_21461:1223-1828(-)